MALPTGVELVGQSVRIRFMWNGRRRCETLAYPQTPQGIQAAASLRATVVQLSKLGMLNDQKYAELFPTSSYFATAITKQQTFGTFAQQYLNGLQVTAGSRRNYRSMLNKYWMPGLAHTPLDQITPALLHSVLNSNTFRSANSRVEVINQIVRVFNKAVDLELMDRNPATKLERPKLMRKDVDPFSAEEADAIIAHLYKEEETHLYAAYFELAFYTGMRPAEIAALRWDEINLKKRAAYVCRIVADGKIAERVKNKKPRFVLLNDRALHALGEARRLEKERMRRELRFAKTPFVFPHPNDTAEYILNSKITDRVFQLTLAQLGIRERPQYNARHTYASRCLMAGMNPSFIAKQLGHKEKVMFDRYATWIEGKADWQEMAKLFGASDTPENDQNGTKVVQEKSRLS